MSELSSRRNFLRRASIAAIGSPLLVASACADEQPPVSAEELEELKFEKWRDEDRITAGSLYFTSPDESTTQDVLEEVLRSNVAMLDSIDLGFNQARVLPPGDYSVILSRPADVLLLFTELGYTRGDLSREHKAQIFRPGVGAYTSQAWGATLDDSAIMRDRYEARRNIMSSQGVEIPYSFEDGGRNTGIVWNNAAVGFERERLERDLTMEEQVQLVSNLSLHYTGRSLGVPVVTVRGMDVPGFVMSRQQTIDPVSFSWEGFDGFRGRMYRGARHEESEGRMDRAKLEAEIFSN